MTRLLPALLLACAPAPTSAPGGAPPARDTADTAAPEGPLVEQFAFVVMADPHVTGPGDHADRLAAAVAWTNAHVTTHDIELVVVLGDIAWGDGFPTAVAALDALTVPWVPVLGDNEIQSSDEAAFFAAFAPQLDTLEGQLDGFVAAPAPVDDPTWGRPSWLQNLAFDHGPVRFLAADWSSRDLDTLWGETPDLHDFDSGTWPWLEAQLQAAQPGLDDSVVLLSHMPLFDGPGGLVVDEAAQVVETLDPHRDLVWGNLAGHLHGTSDMTWEAAGIEVHVTDATWDDEVVVRVVTVSASDRRVSYDHELVVVTPEGDR